jgi:hypothetical protein
MSKGNVGHGFALQDWHHSYRLVLDSVAHNNKPNELRSICCQNPIFYIILCYRRIYYDMKAKVRRVEPVEVVIARQRQDKIVSPASHTDATIDDAVSSVRRFVANGL